MRRSRVAEGEWRQREGQFGEFALRGLELEGGMMAVETRERWRMLVKGVVGGGN